MLDQVIKISYLLIGISRTLFQKPICAIHTTVPYSNSILAPVGEVSVGDAYAISFKMLDQVIKISYLLIGISRTLFQKPISLNKQGEPRMVLFRYYPNGILMYVYNP